MNMNELCQRAQMISDLANRNLGQLVGKCQEEIEVQDYYLGVLRRHAVLLSDLALILKNRNSQYISTPFIILRSLLDDFLHLLYLELHIDKETEIVKINADAYKQSFGSLKSLTDSNYENFDGLYPFYLKNEELEELKAQFSQKEKNKKYFKDVDNFVFKKFLKCSQVAERIKSTREINIYRDRAYYLWKEFSSFVHYSIYSFKMELERSDENMNIIDESLQYCYNSVNLAFKYFEIKLNIQFIDDDVLREIYGNKLISSINSSK